LSDTFSLLSSKRFISSYYYCRLKFDRRADSHSCHCRG
jgi:hypothetical protein